MQQFNSNNKKFSSNNQQSSTSSDNNQQSSNSSNNTQSSSNTNNQTCSSSTSQQPDACLAGQNKIKKCPKFGVEVKSGFPFTDHSWAFALSTKPIVRNRQAGVVPIKKINIIAPTVNDECFNQQDLYQPFGDTFYYRDLSDPNNPGTCQEVIIQP